MSILFHDIVFGPIKSRRLGTSLGINLLPLDKKICNFDCIYCECGLTNLKAEKQHFLDKNTIIKTIEERFKSLFETQTHIDAITFAGNGEPTMHPDFEEIIDQTISLRSKYLKNAKVAVLSNGAFLNNKSVFDALLKVDYRIMKLDAGSDKLFKIINQPLSSHDLNWYIDKLLLFNGDLFVQTLFFKGTINKVSFDNTTDQELEYWLALIKKLHPKKVMIYSLDRETPYKDLVRIEPRVLVQIESLVKKLGIDAQAY